MRPTDLPSKVRAGGLRAPAIGRAMGALLAAVLAFAAAPAQATDAEYLAPEASVVSTLHVPVGKSAALRVEGPVSRIVIAQPEIAQVAAAGPHSVYVMGRDHGATNLLVYGRGAELLQVVNIAVGYDGPQLEDDLRAALPDERVTVESLNGGLLLRGQVSTSEAAAMVVALAEHAAPGAIISQLDVRPSQVMLEVKLVEIGDDTLRDLGVQVAADGSHLTLRSGSGLVGAGAPQTRVRAHGDLAGLDLTAALQALEQRGEARIVAQPRLVALSGEKAGFLAGGEFPYPVPQDDGKVTIEFRPYGASLNVIPTVQTNGMIRLRLASELSSLDSRNALQLAGGTVSALLTRRASTTADVKDGETLLIAGLFQDGSEAHSNATPYLGRLPASERARRQRLQLSIMVTAHLVGGPASDARQARDLARADEIESREVDPAPPKVRLAKAGRLPRLVARSPLASAVVARAASVGHAVLDLPRKGWTLVQAWARRTVGAARARAPPSDHALAPDPPPAADQG
jgi:pilus assembly protein CpaC